MNRFCSLLMLALALLASAPALVAKELSPPDLIVAADLSPPNFDIVALSNVDYTNIESSEVIQISVAPATVLALFDPVNTRAADLYQRSWRISDEPLVLPPAFNRRL